MRETDIDVEELVAKVRGEVARRRGIAELAAAAGDFGSSDTVPLEIRRTRLSLRKARRVANIGVAVPGFRLFGPVRRYLARVVTRMLYYPLQVITVDQRLFNHHVLSATGTFGDALAQVHLTLSARVAKLEDDVAERDARLAALENALAERDAKLVTLEAAAAEGEARLSRLEAALSEREIR